MSRKMTHVIQLAWMLCLIGNATVASAVTLVWVGGQEGNAWGIAENWDPAQVPGADDTVVIETQPGLGPIIDETHVGANAAICTGVEGSNNSLDVTGGNFTILSRLERRQTRFAPGKCQWWYGRYRRRLEHRS